MLVPLSRRSVVLALSLPSSSQLTHGWLTGSLPIRRGTIGTTSTASRSLAATAPGVDTASVDQLKEALRNPQTTVVDVRKLEELQESGYFVPPNNIQWVHAPCTLESCPLLDLASDGLLRNGPSAPVIVYCASGKRATKAQTVLQAQVYT